MCRKQRGIYESPLATCHLFPVATRQFPVSSAQLPLLFNVAYQRREASGFAWPEPPSFQLKNRKAAGGSSCAFVLPTAPEATATAVSMSMSISMSCALAFI
ncbi:hypothetical protein AWZ03_013530 [Drosophila navojoa]|uniref:Uncharacterized protein n=1 Tax=Drosophila navojoa TaxID=7232 RepID=A0A484AUG5_DRONA|nr:hypothetical protein AWZ03_013530 [Drosophila navojoa]